MAVKYSSDTFTWHEGQTLIAGVLKTSSDVFSFSESQTLAHDSTIHDSDVFSFADYGTVNTRKVLTLEIALNQPIFSASPTWTDISTDLKKFSVKRLRQHELGRIQAGTSIFSLSNENHNYYRYNASSPLYPFFQPLTLIRFSASFGAINYPVFYGYIEAPNNSWINPDEAGFNPIVHIQCVDFFKSFNRFSLQDANPLITDTSTTYRLQVDSVDNLFPEQNILIYSGTLGSPGLNEFTAVTNYQVNKISYIDPDSLTVFMYSPIVPSFGSGDHLKKFPSVSSGERMADCMAEIGFPLSMCNIDSGTVNVLRLDPDANGGKNVLEHMYDVQDAEFGRIFIAPNGKFTFQDELSRTRSPYNVSQATFSDSGLDSLYATPTLSDDDTYIWNEANFSWDSSTGFVPQTYRIDYLQRTQGPRAFPRKSSQLASPSDAFNQAFSLVNNFSSSFVRVDELLIKPDASPNDLYPIVLGLDISAHITFILNSARNPAGIVGTTGEYFVEGISHEGEAGGSEPMLWKTSWQLWRTYPWFVSKSYHTAYYHNGSYVSYLDGHDASTGDLFRNDPTCTPPPSTDADIRIGQQLGYNMAVTPPTFEGVDIWRGLVGLDLSGLPTGQTIKYAILAVYVNSSPVGSYFQPWDLTVVSSDSLTLPIPNSGAGYGVLGTEVASYGSGTISNNSGWVMIPLDPTAISLIQANVGGSVKFGLRSSRDISSLDAGQTTIEWVKFDGFDTTISQQSPRLFVGY